MRLETVYWEGVQQPRGPVTERWQLEQVNIRSRQGFRFTIEESSAESGKLIVRTIVTVSGDDGIQRYLSKHPVFASEPRPFFLWLIYDVSWKIKMVLAEHGKPRVTNVRMGAMQGGSIEMTISAEVFYESGGDTLLHLVNYAAHAFHAVQTVQEKHLDRFPEQWLAGTRERFYAERAGERQKEKAAQELHLRARVRDQIGRSLYIDESGDLGLEDASHYYISCGVVVKNDRVQTLEQSLKNIIAENWRGSAPKEIHFSQLPDTKFDNVTSALAECFDAHVESAVCFAGENLQFFRHLLRCEAEFNRIRERPIETNIADLIADQDAHPRRKLLIFLAEELISHVGMDCIVAGADLQTVHDRKHKDWANRALEKGFSRSQDAIRQVAAEIFGQQLCPVMSFRVAASETEPCLWLSDWIAYEFGAWLRGGDLSPAFLRVQSRVAFFGFGEAGEKVRFDGPGGNVVAHYPDWPREIRSIL
jgi:hypothetical protein